MNITADEFVRCFNANCGMISDVSRIASGDSESFKSQLAESDTANNPNKRQRLLLSAKETDSATDRSDLDDGERLLSFWCSNDGLDLPEVQRGNELIAEGSDKIAKVQNLDIWDIQYGKWQARIESFNTTIGRWLNTVETTGIPDEVNVPVLHQKRKRMDK